MGRPQFLVETTGDKCFICSKDASTIKIEPVVREEEGGDGDDDPHISPVPVTFSFQNIFQYVKVDVSDILPPGGVSMAGSSNNNSSFPTLEGRLCSGCDQLSQQFSSYFLELAAIRMKLDSCLKSIYDKMVVVTPGSEEDALVNELRRRAVEGCSRKLSIVSPQVTVERWRDVAILPHDLDVKVESDLDLDITTSDTPEPDPVDVGPTYLRAQTPSNEKEETEYDSSSYMECDICHLKVMDLFTHHATTHNTSNLATKTLKLLENECNLCGKTFGNKWALARHKRRDHQNAPPAGQLLEQSPPDAPPPPHDEEPGPWKRFLTIPSVGFQCDKCNRTFTGRQGRESLRKHQQSLNGCTGGVGVQAPVCTCRVCGKGFRRLACLRNHINANHRDPLLREHFALLTHSDSGPPPPKQCKSPETFILPHVDPDPAQDEDPPSGTGIEDNHNCKFCTRQFLSRNGLARHLALAHLSKIATKVVDNGKELSSANIAFRYSCKGCGTRFTKDELGQHLWKGRCFN